MREHDTRERRGAGSDAPPPVYPGESTDIGGGERDAAPGSGVADTHPRTAPAESGSGSDTTTDADTVTDTDPATDTGTATDTDPATDTDTVTDTGTATDTGTEREPGTEREAGILTHTGTERESIPEHAREPDAPTGLGEDATRSEGVGEEGAPARLLDPEDEHAFRDRWHEIQSRFVDDPREAVHEADSLVTDVIRRLAATFADRKKDLEGQWNEGGDVDTESLRKALRQYRTFFNRLLTT
ncbi:hypothetical protein [Streptomyces sp. E-08]|uniref:hypothetical protein n=1 Tax=Streptomyces sp. E-08 TaxID=3404047 RepID=UPI003CEEFDC1